MSNLGHTTAAFILHKDYCILQETESQSYSFELIIFKLFLEIEYIDNQVVL